MLDLVKSRSARTRPRRPKGKQQPAIGWVLISRAEVAKAEELLHGGEQGIVDELGLLAIHQAVADRLFPGTSVLHTRLRYALFVPWLMQMAAGNRNPVEKLAHLEFDLTGHLLEGTRNTEEDTRGIIGSRVYPQKHAAQPPSYSYWSALSVWGILGRDYVRAQPSREAVLEELASELKAGSAVDMDGQPVTTNQPLFDGLPSPPAGFLADPKGATFKLRPSEKNYLVRRLTAVKAHAAGTGELRESFLAALARQPVKLTPKAFFWEDEEARARAPVQDQPVLDLARDISALGGIARAVYLALVEQACDDQGLNVLRTHRDHLKTCRDRWAAEAARAKLDALVESGLGLQRGRLYELLAATQKWVRSSARTPDDSLKKIYSLVEHSRKTTRARLAGTHGASTQLRRWARFADRSTPADRLHFRWPQVGRLIRDLHE